jgi:hypothetical protein
VTEISLHVNGVCLPVSLELAGSPSKEPVRVHLDLYTREQARHIGQLAELGATRVEDWPYPPTADLSSCVTRTAMSSA